MLMQYTLVFLACFSSKLQAARVHSKAEFVPALEHLHPTGFTHGRPLAGWARNQEQYRGEPINVPEQLAFLWRVVFEERNVLATQYADWKKQFEEEFGRSTLAGALLTETRAIQQLVAQPPVTLGVHECLGRGAMVPGKAYQIKQENQTQILTTPHGAFGIIPEHQDRLTLWTPWTTTNPGSKLGLGIDNLVSADPTAGSLQRGECCGLSAQFKPMSENGMIRLQVQCTGAPEGHSCRLRNPLKARLGRQACRDGYRCKMTTSNNEGIGECQPVR